MKGTPDVDLWPPLVSICEYTPTPDKPVFLFLVKISLFLYHVPKCLADMYVCVPHICLVTVETWTGHQISSNWSYEWFRAALYTPGDELGSSAKAASAVNP